MSWAALIPSSVTTCAAAGCPTGTSRSSLDRWVADLATVIDAAGVERCSLLGISGGAAAGLAYAARDPDRVERVIAYGGWATGNFLRTGDEREAFRTVLRAGWATPHPAFRHVFTMMFLPEGTPEQMAWYDELQRRCITADTALRIYDALAESDATELLPRVQAPTLVLHARGDQVVPFEQGRRIGGRAVGATDHARVAQPPAPRARASLGGVRPRGPRVPRRAARPASRARRSESTRTRVMQLVSQGLSNEEIAERLFLSVRTVKRHLSNVYAKLRISGKSARAAAAARFSQVG